MSELIFHHYDESPFSETIRLCFGHKRLAWRSVIQPQIMPKPHLVPLTGGYRKIPVLQIGADVYCDSQRIAREIERRFPDRTLFPNNSEGIGFATKFWADRLLFLAAVPVLFGKIGPAVPEAFIEDRKKLMGGGDFRAMMATGPTFAEQLRAHAQLLDAQLADDRPFLLGDGFAFADAAAVHPIWFLLGMPPTREAFDEFPRVVAWAARLRAIGHGERSEMTPEAALAVARDAKPATVVRADPDEPNGLAPGDRARVVPDDYGFDPVEGEVVALGVHEIALRRESPEIGEVVVHFPRAGFRVTKLDEPPSAALPRRSP
jgi:glutathione S-transferase